MIPTGGLVLNVSSIAGASLATVLGPLAVLGAVVVLAALAGLVVASWQTPRTRGTVTAIERPAGATGAPAARRPAA